MKVGSVYKISKWVCISGAVFVVLFCWVGPCSDGQIRFKVTIRSGAEEVAILEIRDLYIRRMDAFSSTGGMQYSTVDQLSDAMATITRIDKALRGTPQE